MSEPEGLSFSLTPLGLLEVESMLVEAGQPERLHYPRTVLTWSCLECKWSFERSWPTQSEDKSEKELADFVQTLGWKHAALHTEERVEHTIHGPVMSSRVRP